MKRSTIRECGLRALCVFMGLATACGLSEIFCRLYRPSPGVQIVAARRSLDFWVEEGVPLWREKGRRGQSSPGGRGPPPTCVRSYRDLVRTT